MSTEEKFEVIKCPTCGAEYLPVEIYIPEAFFSRPLKVNRDKNGKITEVVHYSPCMTEHYVCDHCNVPFNINAKVSYTTKPETKFDFDSEYSTSLKKESLFLSED